MDEFVVWLLLLWIGMYVLYEILHYKNEGGFALRRLHIFIYDPLIHIVQDYIYFSKIIIFLPYHLVKEIYWFFKEQEED